MINHFDTYKELNDAINSGMFLLRPEFGPATFHCSVCGKAKPLNTGGDGCGTGYGLTGAEHPNFICYDCCGKRDVETMIADGKHTLYLTIEKPKYPGGPTKATLSNWPGTLEIDAGYVSIGRHNIAGRRYDVDFTGPDGKQWHGTTYGDDTQICYVKRKKR